MFFVKSDIFAKSYTWEVCAAVKNDKKSVMSADGKDFNTNIIENIRAFNVSAVVSAYYYPNRSWCETQYERYNFSQMMLVLDGEGVYKTENGEYKISKGMMFYRPANKTSIYQWHSERACIALISFVCHSEAMGIFEEEPTLLCEEEMSILLDVIKTCTRCCELLKSNEPFKGWRFKPGTPDVVIGFISASLERFLSIVYCRLKGIDLLVNESQKANVYIDSSKLVEDVKKYLDDNLSNRLTIHDVCAHFGVSQSSLTKKFRTETRSGLMEYFNRMKTKEAENLIRECPDSFSEISEKLGFSSSGYFSKVFKKHTGMTPTEYSKYVSKRRMIK